MRGLEGLEGSAGWMAQQEIGREARDFRGDWKRSEEGPPVHAVGNIDLHRHSLITTAVSTESGRQLHPSSPPFPQRIAYSYIVL